MNPYVKMHDEHARQPILWLFATLTLVFSSLALAGYATAWKS